MQYASKYYDPVKRHEYYMKHRQLKGDRARTSTAGLNEEGKIAAKEVREGIKADLKEYNQKIKEMLKEKIQVLRDELKGMSKEERKERKEEYKQRIADLRQAAKDVKARAKAKCKELYIAELDKIKQDPSFQLQKKGKKGKKSKRRKYK